MDWLITTVTEPTLGGEGSLNFWTSSIFDSECDNSAPQLPVMGLGRDPNEHVGPSRQMKLDAG